MKKKTYKLIEGISNSILNSFPYLSAKEHSEVMENIIYNSLIHRLKEGTGDDELGDIKNPFVPKFMGALKDTGKYIKDRAGEFNSGLKRDIPPIAKGIQNYFGDKVRGAIDANSDYDPSGDFEVTSNSKITKKGIDTPTANVKDQKNIAMIVALTGASISVATALYVKYGPSIIKKIKETMSPSMLEKAKIKFKELMKKIKLAESRRLYTKNKKFKIKEGLSNSPLNPAYETDGIFNYPYGKKDTNVEEFIKANPATLSLATALVAVTGWSLIKCVKFIIKKGEDAAKLLVNLGKKSDKKTFKKTLLKKAIDKYVNN